jgi:hypothetical protein
MARSIAASSCLIPDIRNQSLILRHLLLDGFIHQSSEFNQESSQLQEVVHFSRRRAKVITPQSDI